MSVNADELTPELRRKLGLTKPPAAPALTVEDVRRRAITTLAGLADLTQAQRRRVLQHALKLNAT